LVWRADLLFAETLVLLGESRGAACSTLSLAIWGMLQAILRREISPRLRIAADPRDSVDMMDAFNAMGGIDFFKLVFCKKRIYE